jgi:hypothetical protein
MPLNIPPIPNNPFNMHRRSPRSAASARFIKRQQIAALINEMTEIRISNDADYQELHAQLTDTVNAILDTNTTAYGNDMITTLNNDYLANRSRIYGKFETYRWRYGDGMRGNISEFYNNVVSLRDQLQDEKRKVAKMKANYAHSKDLFNACIEQIRRVVSHDRLQNSPMIVRHGLRIISSMIDVLLVKHKQFDVAKNSYTDYEKKFQKQIDDWIRIIDNFEERVKSWGDLYRDTQPELVLNDAARTAAERTAVAATALSRAYPFPPSDEAEKAFLANFDAHAFTSPQYLDASAPPYTLPIEPAIATSSQQSNDLPDHFDVDVDVDISSDATSPKPPGLGGGLKRRRSKPSSYKYYLKAFKSYSKRKLKTFRKRRNYKKTKHGKH